MAEGATTALLPIEAGDGHAWQLPGRVPSSPSCTLLWLPALGVAARHYLLLAEELAAHDVAVFVHEWRGHGSSNLRAGHGRDWGYRELLEVDIPESQKAIARYLPLVEKKLGGHSLGGQLACCRVAMDGEAANGLWLVASGSPYWRAFPIPARYALPLGYRLLPWLAERNGALPGRRIGFGGSEARGVMSDWAGTARSGRYGGNGIDIDLESALSTVTAELRGVLFTRDWLAPPSSLQYLASKMPLSRTRVSVLDSAELGARADHFDWMRRPERVARCLVGDGLPGAGIA
ncbi:MAG: alpha/beta fold hydrolase [Pseudomonadota bacterium]|nr:alpha/beta fold hydrolase [Pseudomonadota bacterium]